MQTIIELQDLFNYSLLHIMIIIIILSLLILVYWMYNKNIKMVIKKKDKSVKRISEKNIKNIPIIQKKFLNQIQEIEEKYINKKIELREAYQSISEVIRLFVFEVTDITTQNYTLTEIKKINLPEVYELIKEYYEPEFASKTVGDFKSAINKARRVIEEWK